MKGAADGSPGFVAGLKRKMPWSEPPGYLGLRGCVPSSQGSTPWSSLAISA
jgi:hypothetical protein